MNREIKFRVWDPENKVWLKGNEIAFTAAMRIYNKKGDMIYNAGICQFTGCQDKNGKEVYEGDVVQIMRQSFDLDDRGNNPVYKPQISKVIYRDHGFWVEDEEFSWEGELMWDWNEMEIIGNIFENPELIK